MVNIFAIIVAIDHYTNNELPRLRSAVSDAKKFAQLLIKDLQVPEANVQQLYDDMATKEAIINAVSGLPGDYSPLQPDDAILFFFSGLAGQAENGVGMICPVDISTSLPTGILQTGISDSTLIRLINQLASSYGNNITLLLDCDSGLFSWNDPSSFVVVAPVDATETEIGGAFTESVVNVLRSEKKFNTLQFLTVQSFIHKLQAYNDKCAIECSGQNTDHPLFNRAGDGAYHTFILGQREVSGNIKLHAGLAHGVLPETKLAFFRSNVKSTENAKLDDIGYFIVDSAETTTAALRPLAGNVLSLPSIFYATETSYPEGEVGKVVKVVVQDLPEQYVRLLPSSGTETVDQVEDANMTLKLNAEKPSVYWNGAKGDKESLRGDYKMLISDIENEPSEGRFVRMLKKATRFAYHLSRTSPADSLLAQSLHVQLLRGEGKITHTDDLLNDLCVELKQKKDKILGPFYLDILNASNYDIWLYVFIFDPQSMSIIPWYPSSSTNQVKLQAGQRRTIGCGDEEGLLFTWKNKDKEVELSYLKVFATKEHTNFSFLMQQYISPTEDRVREHRLQQFPDPRSDLRVETMDDDLQTMTGKVKFGGLAEWTTVRIGIVCNRVENSVSAGNVVEAPSNTPTSP
ncbi:hypothetical protein M422DRAFT_46320 [Sphaerobolus stellatus SS14]|uniref:Peptidase C14 caspase domain-containing protein n=1 Tax=Sphaerobolus stellatus (strain SS14) TaxID=990650 RepID=A0A0C9UT23_SPHS4|nr:hypothetical protein M422DRAFT_46320 [Sphaerobolus stellatus SS14]